MNQLKATNIQKVVLNGKSGTLFDVSELIKNSTQFLTPKLKREYKDDSIIITPDSAEITVKETDGEHWSFAATNVFAPKNVANKNLTTWWLANKQGN